MFSLLSIYIICIFVNGGVKIPNFGEGITSNRYLLFDKEFYLDGGRQYVTVYIDDHSRFITCFGVFDTMTAEHSISVLQAGIDEYGCPEQILTDNGSTYCCIRSDNPIAHSFDKFLLYHGI